MIWESYPWKQDLARTADYFSRLQSVSNLSEKQRVAIEKRTFLGFYSIRKLVEARKLSDQIRAKPTLVTIFPPTGIEVTYRNWHRSDEHFHLDKPHKETWSLVRLCHQFVHSFVFHLMENESGFHGVMVASDHQRAKGLLQLKLTELIPLFEAIATDDIVSSKWQKDPQTGKETFTLSNIYLPDEPSLALSEIDEGEQGSTHQATTAS